MRSVKAIIVPSGDDLHNALRNKLAIFINILIRSAFFLYNLSLSSGRVKYQIFMGAMKIFHWNVKKIGKQKRKKSGRIEEKNGGLGIWRIDQVEMTALGKIGSQDHLCHRLRLLLDFDGIQRSGKVEDAKIGARVLWEKAACHVPDPPIHERFARPRI